MDEKEVTRKLGDPVVVCQYPDVCLSPTAPAPYLITASFADAQATADTVNATKVPTFTMASFLPGVTGDEAGTGCGMKSGTHAVGGICWPTGASTTVKAKKNFVVRHDDPFMMNNGNVPGLANYPKGSAPRAAVNDAGEPTLPTKPLAIVAEAPVEGNFFTGLGQSLTETVEGVAGQAKTLWDATGIYATDEATAAARTAISSGAANLGSVVKDAALSATVPFYETEEGLLALARTADRESAIGDAVVNRYGDAIDEGGVQHATGLLFGDAVQFVASFGTGGAIKGVRGAEAIAALEKVEDVASLTTKTEKALGAVNDLSKVDLPSLPKGGIPDAPSLPKGGIPEAPPKQLLLDAPKEVPDAAPLQRELTKKEGPNGARVKVEVKKADIMDPVEKRRANLTPEEKAAIDADKAKISELSAESKRLEDAGDLAGSNAKLEEARAILAPHVAKGDVFGVIERLDVATEANKGFLWSGDFDGALAAARGRGGSLLETTLGGRVANGWGALREQFTTPEFWGPLSDNYAAQLSGHVSSFQAPGVFGVGGDIFNAFEVPQLQLGQVTGRVTGFDPVKLPLKP